MKKGANIMCTVDKVRRTKSAFIVVFVVVFFCAQRERSHLSQSTIKSFEIYASFCAFITDGCFLSLSFSLPQLSSFLSRPKTVTDQRHPRVRPGPRPRDNLPETVNAHRRFEWCRENHHNRVLKNGQHGRVAAERAIGAGVYTRSKSRRRHGSEGTDKIEVSE